MQWTPTAVAQSRRLAFTLRPIRSIQSWVKSALSFNRGLVIRWRGQDYHRLRPIAALGAVLQQHRIYNTKSGCLHKSDQHSNWYRNSWLVLISVETNAWLFYVTAFTERT